MFVFVYKLRICTFLSIKSLPFCEVRCTNLECILGGGLVWGGVGWSGGGDVRHYSIVRADLWYLDIVYTVCTLTLHISFCLLLF